MSNLGENRRSSAKVRLDFTDSKGARYLINIERPTKESLGKLLDFVDSVSNHDSNNYSLDGPIDTNFARVYGLVQTKLKFGSFNSNDVLQAYEHEFHLPSTLSTISTYLARLSNRGLLIRQRSGFGWTYRLAPKTQENFEFPQGMQQEESGIPR